MAPRWTSAGLCDAPALGEERDKSCTKVTVNIESEKGHGVLKCNITTYVGGVKKVQKCLLSNRCFV